MTRICTINGIALLIVLSPCRHLITFAEACAEFGNFTKYINWIDPRAAGIVVASHDAGIQHQTAPTPTCSYTIYYLLSIPGGRCECLWFDRLATFADRSFHSVLILTTYTLFRAYLVEIDRAFESDVTTCVRACASARAAPSRIEQGPFQIAVSGSPRHVRSSGPVFMPRRHPSIDGMDNYPPIASEFFFGNALRVFTANLEARHNSKSGQLIASAQLDASSTPRRVRTSTTSRCCA